MQAAEGTIKPVWAEKNDTHGQESREKGHRTGMGNHPGLVSSQFQTYGGRTASLGFMQFPQLLRLSFPLLHPGHFSSLNANMP